MKTKPGYYTRTPARTDALYEMRPAEWGIIIQCLRDYDKEDNDPAIQNIECKINDICA
jgi:hypothetical protein